MYGIPKSTSVNDFIGSLPKPRMRQEFRIEVDGEYTTWTVKAYTKTVAQDWAEKKFPNCKIKLYRLGYAF